MHRQAVSVLCAVIVLGVAGCGDDSDPRPATPSATPTAGATATATIEPNPMTSVPTDTPTGPSTNTPTNAPTNAPTHTPTNAPTSTPPVADYPAQQCASDKQAAAGRYCQAVYDAYARWDHLQDQVSLDNDLGRAHAALGDDWTAADAAAAAAGVDCSDRAVSVDAATDTLFLAASAAVTEINRGLDLPDDATCGAALLTATGQRCAATLAAESGHVADLAGDRSGARLNAAKAVAAEAFSEAWAQALAGGCSHLASPNAVAALVDGAAATLVLDTIVAPGVPDTGYLTISPTGSVDYLGKTLTPICMDGSPYHFFARRGTVNKLVVYYQGGGACWEGLTCAIPVCDANVDPAGSDNPNRAGSGFADRDNPANPFRDWHSVVVSYCSCDVHYGDAAQDYPNGNATVHVEHRGFHNAGVAEKWAREHFVNPEMVFVTGSSAGAYGAWFNAVSLQRAWPASRFDVLADAGNGVITAAFLAGPFGNWGFTRNLPDDIPGVRESIENGTGIIGYTEAVTAFFPDTDWAHYTTAFDGGIGGQTGFYNIMLNNNSPIAALRWWDASCAFTAAMRAQALATAAAVPGNYRYYIGTGSRHTMWGANKVYDDTTGGVPTVVDWVNAMLANVPDASDEAWTNVECENCGLLLPGDPQPSPLEAPFQPQGDDVVVVCE